MKRWYGCGVYNGTINSLWSHPNAFHPRFCGYSFKEEPVPFYMRSQDWGTDVYATVYVLAEDFPGAYALCQKIFAQALTGGEK